MWQLIDIGLAVLGGGLYLLEQLARRDRARHDRDKR